MTCFWFCYFLFACLYCGEMHVFTYAVPIDILDHLISCLLSLCLVTIVLACACCNGVVLLWISIRNVCACGFQIYGAYFVSTIWSIRVSLCHWVWLQARMVHAEKCTESGLIMSCMVSTFHCILYLCCASPLIHSALFSVLAHASAPNYVSGGWCSMLFNRHLRLWQWQWQACRLQTSVIFCREVDWQCARFVLYCVFIAGPWLIMTWRSTLAECYLFVWTRYYFSLYYLQFRVPVCCLLGMVIYQCAACAAWYLMLQSCMRLDGLPLSRPRVRNNWSWDSPTTRQFCAVSAATGFGCKWLLLFVVTCWLAPLESVRLLWSYRQLGTALPKEGPFCWDFATKSLGTSVCVSACKRTNFYDFLPPKILFPGAFQDA